MLNTIRQIKVQHYQSDIENTLLFLEGLDYADKNVKAKDALAYYPYLLNFAGENPFYRIIVMERIVSKAYLEDREATNIFRLIDGLSQQIANQNPAMTQDPVYLQEMAVVEERRGIILNEKKEYKSAVKAMSKALEYAKKSGVEELTQQKIENFISSNKQKEAQP